ncbi:MAG TPA: class I SAM-dependent methyltransferase [Gaiellaceae bacterium]|nr:class I SAM-dependent methyltransferase [Gaiellaceae bacterium]
MGALPRRSRRRRRRLASGEGGALSFLVSEEVERYAEAHTTPAGRLLDRLAEETRASLDRPEMLTGPIEGRFLQFLVFALRPRRVLELGTYSGYSAISMASALPPGGHLDTCEIDERHAAVAARYVEEAGYGDRITIHVGSALETLERLGGDYDFVFVDADKPNYSTYYDLLLPRLSAQGLMAFDNTLWSGRVVDPDGSEETSALVALNDRLASDPAVVAVQLTVRDGITLVRRA